MNSLMIQLPNITHPKIMRSNGLKCPKSAKTNEVYLKMNDYLSSISLIHRKIEKCNSFYRKLSSSDLHRPSNKPKRLQNNFWATLSYNRSYEANSYHDAIRPVNETLFRKPNKPIGPMKTLRPLAAKCCQKNLSMATDLKKKVENFTGLWQCDYERGR